MLSSSGEVFSTLIVAFVLDIIVVALSVLSDALLVVSTISIFESSTSS
jgi:hypothetical protein